MRTSHSGGGSYHRAAPGVGALPMQAPHGGVSHDKDGLFRPKHKPLAPDCVNQAGSELLVDCAPKIVDVHINNIGPFFKLRSPDFFADVVSREDGILISQ